MRRLALFASGPVGERVVEITMAASSESLAVVLLADGEDAETAARIRLKCGSIPVLSTGPRVSDELLERLRGLQIDLGVLAWWPYIIGVEMLRTLPEGFLNLHPSLLPHNRGKDPNFWALVEERPFGVSIHFVDAGIDDGDIAFQARRDTSWEDTGEDLYRWATKGIVDLYDESLDVILNGEIPRIPQDLALGSYHRRRELEAESRIPLDEEMPARALLNKLRARTFPPHPAAWFEDGGVRYEVRVTITRLND